MIFKIIFIFLCVVYLLRLLSPFLFKLLFSSIVKKTTSNQGSNEHQSNTKSKQNKTSSESIGEYVDYEEVE
ncbi:DUF4834 family protein [Flavobacteriaceae bacterium]|nr:DUF4834 family protein [Flavobacteriaceae bacterium]